MDEFLDSVRVPKERVAVVIGEKGTTKKKLEKKMDVKLKIDSEEGEVEIRSKESIKLLDATNVIKAIARGFNPRVAIKIMKEENSFVIIDISDIAGRSKKTLARIKGRIIGTAGKARIYIEQMTNTDIVVFGRTVSIIGEAAEVEIAKKAVNGLLKGSNHSTVYKILEEHKRKMKHKL